MLIRHWVPMWAQPLALVAALVAVDAQTVQAPRQQVRTDSFTDARVFAHAASTVELAAAGPAPTQTAPVQVVDSATVQRPLPALTREQHNIVRFVANRYSVASDAAQHFVAEAFHAAKAARVDPLLVLAIMSIESSFNPMAQSNRGAKGLMQVLARVHHDKFEPFGGVKAAFEPIANIRVGTSILKEYLTRAGSVQAALKWYVGAAQLDDDGGYGAKVLFERARIAAAAAGKPVPTSAPRIEAAMRSPAANAPVTDEPSAMRVRWSDARDPVDAGPDRADAPAAAEAPSGRTDAPAAEPVSASVASTGFDRDGI